MLNTPSSKGWGWITPDPPLWRNPAGLCNGCAARGTAGGGVIELTWQHQLCDVKMRRLPCRRRPRRDWRPTAAIKSSWSRLLLPLKSAGGSLEMNRKRCSFFRPQCRIGRECNLKPETTPSSDCQDLYVNCATIILLISSLLFLETPSKKWKTYFQNLEYSLSLRQQQELNYHLLTFTATADRHLWMHKSLEAQRNSWFTVISVLKTADDDPQGYHWEQV